jgi:tRNA dimethylallyltransferase
VRRELVIAQPGQVLAIVGPTGSGKSRAAMQLAARMPDVEIVAIDAFTIYRGMDVGTAKPSEADRAAVPHHCVDLLEPDQDVTVSWFQEVARAAIADVHARGAIPLLVGGSGLYFRAVVDDMRFPPTDPALRAALEERWSGQPEAAHAAVAAADPTAADRIEPGNVRRSIRALEVMQLTGRPFSEYAVAARRSVVGPLTVAYLEPPREVLRPSIESRAVAMVADGLVSETAGLVQRIGAFSSTATQAIGYAEALQVLRGEVSEDTLADAITIRTWGYARRQRAWFRRDPRAASPARSVDEVVARFC